MIKEKTGMYLAYFFQFMIFISIFFVFFNGNYFYTAGAAIALFITFLPAIIRRRWNITLPWTLNFLIALSLYFYSWGLAFNFYGSYYPFYDKFGHFFGSIVVALLGFASVIIVSKHSKLKLTKNQMIFFIIIFTMAIGAFWEILEFSFDQIFGTRANADLSDAMYDMIFNFIGSLVIAVITNINFETMKENIVKVDKKN